MTRIDSPYYVGGVPARVRESHEAMVSEVGFMALARKDKRARSGVCVRFSRIS